MIQAVTITDSGRMNLPADMRKRLGVPGGGTVWAEETPDGILIRNVAQLAAVSQGMAKRYAARDPEDRGDIDKPDVSTASVGPDE